MDPLEYYRPPKAELATPEQAAGAGREPLATIRQITAATFFGGPLAGAILLGNNYRALGDLRARSRSLLWGVVGTAVVVVLAVLLPDKFPSSVLPIAYTMGLRALAMQAQGAAVSAHRQAGGAFQSNWRIAGITAACLVGFVAVGMGVGVVMAVVSPDQAP